jgi:signal peptidase I
MDFALIMFIALVATGLIWAADRLWWAPLRLRATEALAKAGGNTAAIDKARREPLLVEYARAFFPVILLVFLLRSFLVEPFRIPSGSMMPGLLAGDFILVNKYTYGLRLPVINRKLVAINSPQRGDVMVFRFPTDPGTNFIKRVVGLPGDKIVYRNKQLLINGEPVPQAPRGDYTYSERGEAGEHMLFTRRLRETLNGKEHDILLSEGTGPGLQEFTIPEGQYFVMGDNRDRSNDSRYWGTVPEENVVGRAFLIWFSWDTVNGGVAWKRIGNSIE